MDAMERAIEHLGMTDGYRILESALDHLKGKVLDPNRFSYAQDFFGPTPEEFLANLVARGEAEEKPELVQIAPLAISDEANIHEYPEWFLQNQVQAKECNNDPKTGA